MLESILSLVIFLPTIAGLWMVYRKMGIAGWKIIVPVYGNYVLCKELYGNGKKCFLLLIPLFNVYFSIKLTIDLVHGFNKKTSFGVMTIFFPLICIPILGFGSAKYGDGSKALGTKKDFFPNAISRTKELSSVAMSKTKEFSESAVAKTKELSESAVAKAKELSSKPKPDEHAMEKIGQLYEMKEKGIISEEEYNIKKEELLKKI